MVMVFQMLGVSGVADPGRRLGGLEAPRREGYSNTEALGAVLYTDYVYAFELAAVILLVAIVAAITLTMRAPGLKYQDVPKQVAVRLRTACAGVNMPAEKDE
jgi:NADH-quinone oxidoreductase subunit J